MSQKAACSEAAHLVDQKDLIEEVHREWVDLHEEDFSDTDIPVDPVVEKVSFGTLHFAADGKANNYVLARIDALIELRKKQIFYCTTRFEARGLEAFLEQAYNLLGMIKGVSEEDIEDQLTAMTSASADAEPQANSRSHTSGAARRRAAKLKQAARVAG